MALTRARTTKNRTIGIKLEATDGTYIAPTSAEAAFIVKDPSIKYVKDDKTFEVVMAQGSAAPSRSIPGIRIAEVKLTTPLMNSGVAATATIVQNLLLCCGFKGTGTNSKTLLPLTPTDVGQTASAGMWEDGRFKSAAGCSFTWKMTGVAGKPVMVEFTGRGVGSVVPADAAMVYGAAPANLPPILISASFQIGGTAICVPGFEIEGGGTVVPRECINETESVRSFQYIPGIITIKVKPDALLLADKNWYAIFRAGTQAAFTVTVGSVTDQKVVMTAPAIQLTGDPDTEDDNGLMRDALEFQCNASAGDDQFQILFS